MTFANLKVGGILMGRQDDNEQEKGVEKIENETSLRSNKLGLYFKYELCN